MHNILVTICARGGSKGVSNKNIRLLLGKPLIAYTIEQAQKWGGASEVVVSTDSTKIAELAKKYNAQVPFIRPADLATDESPKIPAIRHALKACEEIYQKKYDIVVDLDPTAPIRKENDIENCYQLFIKKKPKTLFSVVTAHKNPYFNMVEEKSTNGFISLCKELPKSVHRRQDAPLVYDMNASIYIYGRDYLLDETNKGPCSAESIVYEMDQLSSYDVDREIDFKFIEFLAKESMVQL